MKIISLTSISFQNAIDQAAQTIQRGGVVIAPTDTVYGLLANATDEAAVKKIYAVKKRALDKPLPIFVKNMAMAKKLATISPKNKFLLEEKWPGKLTAIFDKNKKNNIKIFGVGEKTIALRLPFNKFINSLLETLNLPLIGTSANISGKPANTKIDAVLQQFQNQNIAPDLIINAGDLPESKPSTIIGLAQSKIKIIRK
jgi:L-threonylcarbamoyladenylate synthase